MVGLLDLRSGVSSGAWGKAPGGDFGSGWGDSNTPHMRERSYGTHHRKPCCSGRLPLQMREHFLA